MKLENLTRSVARSRQGHGRVFGPPQAAVGVGLLVLVGLASGCGSDAASIAALKAINEKLVAAGEKKAVLMQMDVTGKSVGTIIVQGHLDEVLPLFSGLHDVSEIYLAETDFGDDQVKYIKGISSLRSLMLGGTKITDAGIKELSSMNLETLMLSGTAVTPACLESLATMRSLKILNLSNSGAISNLAPLERLESLEWLLLSNLGHESDLSGISNEDIASISKIPKLTRLTALGSGITESAIKLIKQEKPSLNLEAGATEDLAQPPVEGVGE